MLRACPLPVRNAVEFALQIDEGLRAAYSADIARRDIKPGNLMVTDHGQAKAMDFALTKPTHPTGLTGAITTSGTLGYMAPEKVAGGRANEPSYIRAFGTVLCKWT